MKLQIALIFFCLAITATLARDISRRIVNGEDADIADFPHALALFDSGRFFCGASVISRYWALTAAHCLDRNTPPSLINLYGNSTSRLSDGILFFVTRYVNHPDYRRISLSTGQVIWDYDVSVIEVDRENPLDGLFVRPTVLPPTCNSACCGACEGTVITLAGWGRTHLGTIPVYLQKLNQTIVNHAACGPFWENQITDRMFCVTADFYDSCDGDSGSGILLTDRVNQIGYVSFGSIRCGDNSAPAVYGRLEHPSIRAFVRSTTGL